MSIINEALKKAQESVKKAAEPPSIQTSAALPSPQPPPTKKIGSAQSKGKRYFLFFTILLAGVCGAIFLIRPFQVSRKSETPKAPYAAPTGPSASGGMPRLTLNGIVYDEKEPYAIVNNKVLLKGEIIGGATLVEINKENVRFAFGDKEFELRQD